jgi:hypothetical protein
MMMTMRRLAGFAARVGSISPAMLSMQQLALAKALNQRADERGSSKLARRMRRKRELGMAGAF